MSIQSMLEKNKITYLIQTGQPTPLGATRLQNGAVNFAIHSGQASSMSLVLFFPPDIHKPGLEISLDPQKNKTGNIWHCEIEGLPDFFYMIHVDNNMNFLLDPYARSVVTSNVWGDLQRPIYFPLGGLEPYEAFDWKGDIAPNLPLQDLIIYEMHVRGFTQDPSSSTKYPGTYLGIIEKIPHLLELGVNAVELLPVHEFNEREYKQNNPITKEHLYNYWGYSTVNFFSPMQRYAFGRLPTSAITEFKTMVKELHRNGIEVILDVVFNHTAEGNEKGPIISFKGLDDEAYYILENGHYTNYSGTGNTFNCNNPTSMALILDALRYWVTEMHVDGFRFDLATILIRDQQGNPMKSPPLIQAMSTDPILAKVKLISEPWDAAGLYQVGSFFPESPRWSEWNGRYRDVVRKFIKGTGHKGQFVSNICGSQDLYFNHSPSRSINFITAHDGFTLADLVSYNRKHNLENGENNRDGNNYNDSWNCGIEGGTDSKAIIDLRLRQMRNLHLALIISRGIPMILMGDEYGHSRRGNNNTWCHDNEFNWFLWNNLSKNAEFYRFYRKLIHFRKKHPFLRQNHFFSNDDVEWHGTELHKPHWDKENQFIAFTLKDKENGNDLYVAFNSGPNPTLVELPGNTDAFNWHWVVNTSSPSPYDFREEGSPTLNAIFHCRMLPYSSIMLQAIPEIKQKEEITG
jgi:isoamylase